jgi:hypothetical protein
VPIVIVGGGVAAIYGVSLKWYRRTIGSRRDLARRLNELACGVTLRFVEERFGIPVFARLFHPALPAAAHEVPRRQPVRELMQVLTGTSGEATARPPLGPGRLAADSTTAMVEPLREFIYREKHAWLQVIVDDSGAVVRFSITATDPRFRFSVRLLTWGHLPLRLGRSRFADVEPTGFTLRGRSLRIGAHNHEYAEAYYFGNPGQYQHFVLSSNELGTGDFGYSIGREGGPAFIRSGVLAADYQLPAGQSQDFDPESEYARKFRAATTINSLTVLGPAGNPELGRLAEPRGPDSLHVRVLVPGRRERREIQRRIKRANAQPRGGTTRHRLLAMPRAFQDKIHSREW